MENVVFEADSLLRGTDIDGRANSIILGTTSVTYRIGVNPDILTKATKEYILATLYHEALHAYFSEKKRVLQSQPGEFERQFMGIEVNGGRLLLVQDEAHLPMGYDRFVRGIKDAVLAFNLNFDADSALVIAKTGIISLNKADNKVNKQEHDTIDPNNQGATGTKCTP